MPSAQHETGSLRCSAHPTAERPASDGPAAFCAIDFGTSNSAVAIALADSQRTDGAAAMRLVPLEGGQSTMPTAVFYFAEPQAHDAGPDGEPPRAFGRAAMAAYIDGYDGRLMRSMKSILGSSLIDQTTDIGGGQAVKYLDVITGYLRHLHRAAEATGGRAITQAVLGRPVFFVDGDPARDAQAQASLESAARAVGLRDVAFQYEPIAAAFDYERQAVREEHVLVADIGGGTSDFSVVRVGPSRIARTERKDDILGSHGVHVAGTDFDRQIELASVLRELGYGALGPARRDGAVPREVPSTVYFDLATWHLINTVYQPARAAELRGMAGFYANPAHHRRLMRAVNERLGHDLAARAEAAKIAVADGGATEIDLGLIDAGLAVTLDEHQAADAIADDVQRIVDAALETVRLAGIEPAQIDALYFTGGSTGWRLLTERIAAAFPAARAVRGDRLASVATGLGLDAQRRFGLPAGR